MHRQLCSVALFALMAGIGSSTAQQPTQTTRSSKPLHVTSIALAQVSDWCDGYCSIRLVVSDENAVLTMSAINEKDKYPELIVKSDISAKRWKSLTQAVDRQALLALPDVVGCPGCADQPIEAIEVHFSDGQSKSVMYNFKRAPVSLSALQEQLSSLEAKLAREIPP